MTRPGPAVVPRATYRLQLHGGFGLAAATALVPYLDRLGISHLYLSPVLKARPGSGHGYDVVDPRQINPELGSPADFEALAAALRARGMGIVLDIVPNHMGVFGADNPWWMDVLAHGHASAHTAFFDIDWTGNEPDGQGRVDDAGSVTHPRRLLLPLLPDHLGVVLERGGLQVRLEAEAGAFAVWTDGHRLPLDPASYPDILRPAAGSLTHVGAQWGKPPETRMETPLAVQLTTLADAFASLPPWSTDDAPAALQRRLATATHQAALASLLRDEPAVAEALAAQLERLNGRPGEPSSFDALAKLLAHQPWRAAHWLAAADDINYRRFVDINHLAALRVQDGAVFEATHGLVRRLVESGLVEGLRVDHVDGLVDPAAYLARLAGWSISEARGLEGCERGHGPAVRKAGRPYIAVEKVLAAQETLADDWPVDGTTGYDFARLSTGLCVDHAGRDRLGRCWRAFVGDEPAPPMEEAACAARMAVMTVRMAGELSGLAADLRRLAAADRRRCDLTRGSLQRVLAAFVANMPVYRTYLGGVRQGPESGSAQDRRAIESAMSAAHRACAAIDQPALGFLRDVLLGAWADDTPRLAFIRRLQPFTAAVMAKGVEDTAFYRHLRLLALNEVGGDPAGFGVRIAAFHRAHAERAQRWPHAMLATSTHDTKRSEDVRARLAVLSEVPAAWRLAVRRWRRMNAPWRRRLGIDWAPSRHDEYLLYQTLVGTLPLACLAAGPAQQSDAPDEADWGPWRTRIGTYAIKAAREARWHTDWAAPQADYESALQAFVEGVLTWPASREFIDDLRTTLVGFARCGAWNSLAVTAWKLTAPGVPDIYQGQEGWDFSLVDPDNRRGIDASLLEARLRGLVSDEASPDHDEPAAPRWGLDPLQGDAKRWLTWRLLTLRREQPELFARGGYRPLSIHGPCAIHAVAYVRQLDGQWLLVITGRLFATLTGLGRSSDPAGRLIDPADWRGTVLRTDSLPSGLRLNDAIAGKPPRVTDGRPWLLGDLLADAPVSVWHGSTT